MKNKIIASIIIVSAILVSFYFYNQNKTIDLKYGDSVNVSSYESIDTSRSSFVDSARYSSNKQHLILELNGNNYEYCDVPEVVWDSFKKASSFGTFYNQQIKSNYSCD